MGYCTRLQATRTGLPPEAFARPPRATERAFPISGRFALRSHGLDADFLITLAVVSSSTLGAPAAAVPGGLGEGTIYYARPLGSDLFQLAPAPSPAAPIATFSDEGTGVVSIVVDHGPYLDDAIEMATAVIDQHARAHTAPITAAALPFVCAFLAARIYVATHRALVPGEKDVEAPSWIRSIIDRLFASWMEGTPILGAVDATPAVAEAGPAVAKIHPGPFRAPERLVAISVADLTPDAPFGRVPSLLGEQGDNV